MAYTNEEVFFECLQLQLPDVWGGIMSALLMRGKKFENIDLINRRRYGVAPEERKAQMKAVDSKRTIDGEWKRRNACMTSEQRQKKNFLKRLNRVSKLADMPTWEERL